MPDAAGSRGESGWHPVEVVGVMLLVLGLACGIACAVIVVRRRRAGIPFAGVDNERGPLTWLFYGAVALVPTALICLIAGSQLGGPPEAGDPCDPGRTPPPGFVCR